MKIGVISDTHGCPDTWRKVFERYFRDADLIIHAGDVLYHGPRNAIPAEYDPKALAEELNRCPVPILAARGNCDAEVDDMVLDVPVQAPYVYAMLEGLGVVVNHGHTLDETAMVRLARKMKAGLLVFGHSHVPHLVKRDGVVLLNPGAPAQSMSKRSDKRGTIGVINGGAVQILAVDNGDVLAREEL